MAPTEKLGGRPKPSNSPSLASEGQGCEVCAGSRSLACTLAAKTAFLFLLERFLSASAAAMSIISLMNTADRGAMASLPACFLFFCGSIDQ